MIGLFFQVCIFAVGFFVLTMFLSDFKVQNMGTNIKMGIITALIVNIICDVVIMTGFIPSGKLILFLFFFIFRALLIYGSLLLCKKIFGDFQVESTKSLAIASVSLTLISSLVGIMFY
ncbi:MAG: hypothetical protein II567_00075 [Candidatus Riflebacteria bacterium]|nr:hypothetical protein [Candidatus Riflebacteria bacterium]